MRQRIIHIHPQAPAKPALGAPCNGCGVCCLQSPCPVGIWVSRRWWGACAALRWDDIQSRYRCGVLVPPDAVRTRWQRWRQAWLRRWIAAGVGCDADWQVQGPA